MLDKKLSKRVMIGAGVLLVLLLIVFNNLSNNVDEKRISEFDVDTLFLKIAASNSNETLSKIEVMNNFGSKDFEINVKGLDDMVVIGEDSFRLEGSDSKTVDIVFDTTDRDFGVYLGELEIVTSSFVRKIPVILEIQSKNALFDSNIDIFPKGKDFYPGDRITSEIKIFDLANVGKSDVVLKYLVKDFEDSVVISEEENVIVEGKLDYSKTLNFPSDVRSGNYALIVLIDYRDSVGTSSVLLKINERPGIIESEDNGILKFFIPIIGLIIFSFLLLYLFFIIFRNKFLGGLQRQYRLELRKQKELMKFRGREESSKLRNVSERRVYKREFNKVRKNRFKEIKKIHSDRVKKVKKILRSGNKDKLGGQLDKWKSRGYDTNIIDKKFAVPTVGNVKREIKKWKSRGYDTKVLEKKLKKKKK